MTANKTIEDHFPKWKKANDDYCRSSPQNLAYSAAEWAKVFVSALDKKKKGGVQLTPWIMRGVSKVGIADLSNPNATNSKIATDF